MATAQSDDESEESETANEMIFLKCTYGDNFEYCELAGFYFGLLQIEVEVPDDFYVIFGEEDEAFEVKHLPPLSLLFRLSPAYPKKGPPEFTLSCPWLSQGHLTELRAMLDEKWNRNRDEVIIFSWAMMLRLETFDRLGIASILNIAERDKVTKSDTSKEESELTQHIMNTLNKSKDQCACFNTHHSCSLKDYLLEYNAHKEDEDFKKSIIFCDVCLEEKRGSASIQFKPCGHTFCKLCCCEYFKLRIEEGAVGQLSCLKEKCLTPVRPSLVRDIVGEELFERYDRLLLARTIDGMTNVFYCPLDHCRYPNILDEEEGGDGNNLFICANCRNAFCKLCLKYYHALNPCYDLKEEAEEEDVDNKDDDEKYANMDLFAKLKRKKKKRVWLEEYNSRKWLKERSKPCPQCKAWITKDQGCDHMVCSKCWTHFCWRCNKRLDSISPYNHFARVGACHV